MNVNVCLKNHFLSASAHGETLRTSDSAGDNYISIHAPFAGATRAATKALRAYRHFNPRSPCGERRANNALTLIIAKFQSTLPVRGATANYGLDIAVYFKFQSTLPVRGATASDISKILNAKRFQSTLPVRGATRHHLYGKWETVRFQSTLPVRGATSRPVYHTTNFFNFNPRSPCGERPSA